MPYKMEKIRGQPFYRVINLDKHEIKAKHTTLEKAKSQIKLLNYIDHRKKYT